MSCLINGLIYLKYHTETAVSDQTYRAESAMYAQYIETLQEAGYFCIWTVKI